MKYETKSEEQKLEEIEDWISLSSRNTIARKIVEKDSEIYLLKEELRRERSCVDSMIKNTPHYDPRCSTDKCNRGRETVLTKARLTVNQRKAILRETITTQKGIKK